MRCCEIYRTANQGLLPTRSSALQGLIIVVEKHCSRPHDERLVMKISDSMQPSKHLHDNFIFCITYITIIPPMNSQ